MSEAKHTPGPWVTFHVIGKDSPNGARIIGRNGEWVASLTRDADKHIDQKRMDASLITAAPDLLSSAKDLLALIEHPSVEPDETCPQIVAMKAAITKAEGRS